MGKLVYLIAVIKCNQQTKTAMYVISAVQLCITKISTPECRGDKTLGVPSTSKSRGDMSPCPPTDLRPWVQLRTPTGNGQPSIQSRFVVNGTCTALVLRINGRSSTQALPRNSLALCRYFFALVFGRPFVKRFALCYRTVVLLSVTLV